MTRLLYRLLLSLHPRGFRQRFALEMLAIFDDAGGGAWLLADAGFSLLRQRLLRGRVWLAVLVPALALALWSALVWLMATTIPPVAGWPERQGLTAGFMLLAATTALFTVVCTTLLALHWCRFAAVRRR